MIKNLDIFPSNPRWSIDGKERGSTWKAFFLTLCILVASVFMTYSNFKHIWITKPELPMVESMGPSPSAMLDSFIVGAYVANASHLPSIILQNTNGGRIPPLATCPQHFAKLQSALICFSVPSLKLSGGDSFKIYLNRTDWNYDRMIFYTEIFSAKNILAQQPPPVQRYQNVFKLSRITISSRKNRLILKNSLIPTADPQIYTMWSPQPQKTTTLPIVSGTSFNMQFVFDVSTNMMIYTVQRESISTIITNYVSNVQFLIGIVGILLIQINSMNLKLDLAKILYSNEEIKNVRVSFFFSIKMRILGLLQLVKLDKLVLRHGYLHDQHICSKAFQDMDEKLGVQNIHKIIQTLKQNQGTQKQIKEGEETHNFDYNLALDVETQGSLSAMPTPKMDKMQISRSKTKRNWLSNLIRSLDSNTVAIEFTVDKKAKSSLFSVIITIIGIGGLIYLLIYIGCFSLQVDTSNFSTFQETQVNWNTTQFPISFYFKTGGITPATSLEVNTTMVAYNSNKNYRVSTACNPVPLSTNNQTLCIDQNVILSSRDDLVIDFVSVQGTTIAQDNRAYIDVVSAYFDEQTIGLRSLTTSAQPNSALGTFRIVYLFQRIVQIRQGQTKQYFSQISAVPRAAFNQSSKLQIRFSISEKVRYRYINNVTISTIFQRIWGLNMIFFIIMALYISKPYNRKIAKKMFGQRLTSTTEQTVEKAQEVLNINKLLLFLRSKCQLVDQNNFFKENIPYGQQPMNSAVEPLP